MGTRNGRLAGQWARRRGVAVCMAKVAPDLVVVVRQHRHPSIVKLDSQIGWLGGVSRRKRGAASTSAKAALQRPADVLERASVCTSQLQHADAFASSSGVCGAIRASRSLPEKK